MVDPSEFACTMGLADVVRRATLLEALVPKILARRRRERTLAIDLTPAAEEEARGFIAEDSKCCPFFSFRLDRIAQGVRLTVETRPGGEAMLDALEAAFAPTGSPVRARFEAAGAPSIGRQEAR